MTQIGKLGTEEMNPLWKDLDRRSVQDITDLMIEENGNMVEALKAAREEIAAAIEAISAHFQRGGRIVYMGAGTSGRLGVMDAAECPPTFGVEKERITGIIAGGYGAMVSAVEKVEDSAKQGRADVEAFHLCENDVLVALAASGRTPYCLGGIEEAKNCGALTVAVCCNKGSEMGKAAEFAIEVATGAEIVAGSTRLKAAAAEKAVLNMISTITMVKAGKVYRNLMVDMRATNEKLLNRSARIFMAATDTTDEAHALKMLQSAEGDLKCAIVMEVCGLNREDAKMLLDKNGGYVRAAIGE